MKKEKVIGLLYLFIKNKRCVGFVFSVALLFCHAVTAETVISAPLPAHTNKTIVLDPGHGGHDSGVQGTGGMLEKNITLSLCRYLMEELTDTYGHRVILTRTNDVDPDIFQRTSVANHHHGDLFISVHLSGSFFRQEKGITISYTDSTANTTSSQKDLPKSYGITPQSDWEHTQEKHIQESRIFAETIKHKWQETAPGTAIQIMSAPLALLEGADMPAILIEVGYLTNPVEEKDLGSPDTLKNHSKLISSGIHAFLKKSD